MESTRTPGSPTEETLLGVEAANPSATTDDRFLRFGLGLLTLATLQLELLDARLLSVLTWYHLSFMAVSLAMLGMAAGAVLVFLAGDRVHPGAARRILARTAWLFALAVPATHFWLVRTPIPLVDEMRLAEFLPLALAIVVLTIPFVLSGAAVTIALTRVGGRIGVLYGFDLLGAALGCLLIVPMLNALDLMSLACVTAAIAATAGFCFARFAGASRSLVHAGTAVALGLGAVVNVANGSPIDVAYPRGGAVPTSSAEISTSNAHSHVMVMQPRKGRPFFWGRGEGAEGYRAVSSMMLIDGAAGTAVTEWSGDRADLAWVAHDVTSLPYHLRAGNTAIIGVGGGRDILAAIWGQSRSITAIELNEIFLDLLAGSHRDFAGLAGRKDVRFVHGEGRSQLTQSRERFDVIQMSLVDTWAATGAGAFTLSENALYTREGWRVFLGRLHPDGILSASRWFHPGHVSETSRLLALAVTTLLDFGAERPADHLALVARGRVATLLTSPTPFSDADLTRIRTVSEQMGFQLLVLPGQPAKHERLRAIAESNSAEELAAAIADPLFDFSAPTDDRPYFFNMLRPSSFRSIGNLPNADVMSGGGGVVWGNIRATATLVALLGITTVLVIGIIFLPLLISGLPKMSAGTFAWSLAYFSLIGGGFMLIQIPLLQRFSVLLGHPVYSFSVIL
ncbi:MAG: class I SAM-dependent methyltransferase, partial [Deltaproteobacteria bacterium]|nr:class I SAM-dependent methyltransferase [Deltaproteobacteria bacterium]